MSCVFNDILVLQMAQDYCFAMEASPETLSPEQRVQIEEIKAMLEEIGPNSVDDEIYAVKEAVKEIRDRGGE